MIPATLWARCGWMVALAATVVGTAARGQAPQVGVLTLENGLMDGVSLTIHLVLRDNQPVAAFGTGYNSKPHDIDLSELKIDAQRLAGRIKVTVNPDAYAPSHGQPVQATFDIDSPLTFGMAGGTFTGVCGDQPRKGAVRGFVGAGREAGDYRRLRLRIPGALRRLYDLKGPNWKYALDMNLIVPLDHGVSRDVKLETIVPDYRRYSALVRSSDLKLVGHELSGTVEAMVDYGGQGTGKGKNIPRSELHRFTLKAVVVGDHVAGTCAIKVGDGAEVAEKFVGRATTDPPPPVTQSLCWIRMHDAMQEGGPIYLTLSLSRSQIHGFCYAPAYNHQPQKVDATGLRLEGDALVGPMGVTLAPDVYKGGEPFNIRYRLEAKVSGGDITGTFEGEDRGQPVKGVLTGETRMQQRRVVASEKELGRLELNLGYCLVSAAGFSEQEPGENHAAIVLTYADGQLTGGQVINPKSSEELNGRVRAAQVKIEGDKITGAVAFQLTSTAVKSGLYRFNFEGIVDGQKLMGFWRGSLDGKPILTKSAKLGGSLAPYRAADRAPPALGG